jgi:hypothetical protein
MNRVWEYAGNGAGTSMPEPYGIDIRERPDFCRWP